MSERNQGMGMGQPSVFLGQGTTINGKVVLDGPAQIDGQVEGEITAQDTLTIGETAVVRATITGAAVVVHGQLTGDITAKVRIELCSASRVHGNISAPTLVIHEGAFFEGQCSMGEAGRGKGKVTSIGHDDARSAAAAG